MWWKWLLSLFVAIPLAAYVAGSLAAVDTQPRPRPPIVIDVSKASPVGSSDSASPRGHDGRDDHGDRGPETVLPDPDDLDNPDDNLGRDDNSGPGSVNSGPGSVTSGSSDDGAGQPSDDNPTTSPTRTPTPTHHPSPTVSPTHDAGDDKGGVRPEETKLPSPSPSPSETTLPTPSGSQSPTPTATSTPDDKGGSGGSIQKSSGGDPVVVN